MNIGSVLTHAARKSPDHTAIIFGKLRRSYREFNRRANQLASQLRKAGFYSLGGRVLQSFRSRTTSSLIVACLSGHARVLGDTELLIGGGQRGGIERLTRLTFATFFTASSY